MGRLRYALLALVCLCWAGPAWSVVGETTVKVADGGTPIPQATVSITFKDQAGRPLRTVRRPVARTGTRKIAIPDNAKTADISVTAANGRTASRTGIDVTALINSEIAIDVPGGSVPPRTAGPPPTARPPAAQPPALPPVTAGSVGVPVAFGGSLTRIPQISGGTRFGGPGIGEVAVVQSRRTIPGFKTDAGIVMPVDRTLWSFDYFSLAVGANVFDDKVNGSVPVGTSSAFTYIFPNPVGGSTGIGPTVTGQTVTIDTKGQFWDVAAGTTTRAASGDVSRGFFWTYGLGVRYRFMDVEHTITQQSSTFADLNVAINLDLRSHFIAPSFTLGFESLQPVSGIFGGASTFIAPGLLITDANARQTSRCGPCGAASPEFNLALQRGFSDDTFAFMTGVNAFVGYRFNPNVRVQAEASYTYLSEMRSFAVPTSPALQPIGLSSNSSDVVAVGGRLIVDFTPR